MLAARLFSLVSEFFGTWRSLVAHLLGVQGVASSNLAVPTNKPAFRCQVSGISPRTGRWASRDGKMLPAPERAGA